jgi:hypothetical protein
MRSMPQRRGHPVGQRLQRGIGQFGGLLVQLPPGAPAGKLVHRERIEDGKQDRRELQHYRDMGPRGRRQWGRPDPQKWRDLDQMVAKKWRRTVCFHNCIRMKKLFFSVLYDPFLQNFRTGNNRIAGFAHDL